jgi:hypothetical protein
MELKTKVRKYEEQNESKTQGFTKIPIEIVNNTNNKSDPEIIVDIDCM